MLWSFLSADGELLPPRLAAILRRLGLIGLFVVEAVGGPGAAVLPRGTRCTASFHGICGDSDEGKSLMLQPQFFTHKATRVRLRAHVRNLRIGLLAVTLSLPLPAPVTGSKAENGTLLWRHSGVSSDYQSGQICTKICSLFIVAAARIQTA